MLERAGRFKDYNKNFFLDEGKLRKICDVLSEYSSKLTEPTLLKFHVRREDDSFYETTVIDEVLSDDNALGRSIKTLSVELHRMDQSDDDAGLTIPDRKKAIAIVEFDRFSSNRVQFIVKEKQRDWCFLLADDLDSQIQRLLKKSQLLRSFPLFFVDLIVFILLSGVILFSLFFFASRVPPTLSSEQIEAMSMEERIHELLMLAVKRNTGSNWILLISIVSMAIILAFIGFRPISRLLEKCSRSVFYWGDMMAIHDAFERKITHIKWGIIIAFVVSLLASLVGSIVVN